MDCGDVDKSVDAYLDGELPQAARKEVESHLAACLRCRKKFGGLMVLFVSPTPAKPPAELRGRIMTAVRQRALTDPDRDHAEHPFGQGSRLWRPWMGAAAASLLFFVLGWFASRLWIERPEATIQLVESPPQRQVVVLSPWLLSGWAQALALRTPANPALLLAQHASMDMLTAELFNPMQTVRLPRPTTTRPMLPPGPPTEVEFITLLNPVLRL